MILEKRNDGRLESYQKEIAKYIKENNNLRLKCLFLDNIKIVICSGGHYGIKIGDTTIVLSTDGKFIRMNNAETPEPQKKKDG